MKSKTKIEIVVAIIFIILFGILIFKIIPDIGEGFTLQINNCINKSEVICNGSLNYDFCFNETKKMCLENLK